ncbi:hypothetical protein GQ53DRAFT_655205 [Thozetella sp. PMI_491]|nr:hypothetical protein GQ53DRAFT_655205 [Thozetella sp. PMI_491]
MPGPGHSGNSTGGDGYHGPSPAFFAQRQKVNERMMQMYAAGICGLLILFIVGHWARVLFVYLQQSSRVSTVLCRPFVLITRAGRNLLNRKVPGFRSAGHALTVAAFVSINASIAFTNVDSSLMANYGHRFGWLTLVNLALLIFLALKNTPLAVLTAYSYERLNCLHQIAGYTMFASMVIHAALYTAQFRSQHKLLAIYSERENIAAIVAGFSFLSVAFSATFLRRIWYELFYVSHVLFWMVGIVCVGFHQPDLGTKALIITLLAGGMWVTDRTIRASRVLYYSANNTVTVYPLSNGGTRVVMKKIPARAVPGKHCFVWIPAIRKLETHPFTVIATNPLEFAVKANNGFTRDLHTYAVAHPGATLRASLDGPYGTFPDPMHFDKIVLIAGGGGATFTFGLAVNVLERMTPHTNKRISFIWSVREHENLSWFREHLDTLKTHTHSPKVKVSLYVTRAPSNDSADGQDGTARGMRSVSSQSFEGGESSMPASPVGGDPEKGPLQLPLTRTKIELDIEKEFEKASEQHVEHQESNVSSTSTTPDLMHAHAFKLGRPDVETLIRDAVARATNDQRVLVAACGPDGLMRVVRQTTASLIKGTGPAVELHCEHFGW